MYRAINEARNVVVEIDATNINPMNDGKLVHLVGMAEPTENLTDSSFGIKVVDKTKLSRNVEMYQWVETTSTRREDKIGGGTTTYTDYKYSKQWRSSLVDSSRFQTPSGHMNPTSMPYKNEVSYSDVIVGAFDLPEDLVSSITSSSSTLGVSFNTTMIPSTNSLAQSKPVSIYGQGFYFGTPNNPQTGDTRVDWSAGAGGGVVSIIAKQTGSSFEPYVAKSEASIYRLEMGNLEPEEMFDNAESDNRTLTMILRFVGALVMILGISAILNPLAVAADIIPCVGDCVGAAVGIVATLIGLFLSLVVIGIAWIAQRPVILGVAVGGAVLVGLLVYNGFRKKGERSRNLNMPPEKNDLGLERAVEN